MAVQKFIPGVSSPGGPFSNPNYLATVLLTCLAWFLGTLVSWNRERLILAFFAVSYAIGILLFFIFVVIGLGSGLLLADQEASAGEAKMAIRNSDNIIRVFIFPPIAISLCFEYFMAN